MRFLNEVLLEALEAFKNFQKVKPFTRNLNFCFIAIGSNFSKSETVVGHILQSAMDSFACGVGEFFKLLKDIA